jgi:putative NADH-flavin reductase
MMTQPAIGARCEFINAPAIHLKWLDRKDMNCMNITIFGASGGIGSILTSIALENGDIVTAYVRSPEKVKQTHCNLCITKGQLTDISAIEKAIADADVVISTLGPSMSTPRGSTETPVADGHANIIRAMEKLGKKRLITLATPSVHAKEDKKSFATGFPGFAAKLFLPSAYRDILKTGETVTSSRVDWTIVRIISPNAKFDGAGYGFSFGDTPAKISVSRRNVAQFMYDTASDPQFIHCMPIVFNK